MKAPTPTEEYWRGKHVVYRVYKDDGLLYIGVTSNLPERIRGHEAATWWWNRHLLDHMVIKVFPTRFAARAAEVDAIRGEGPRFNVEHNAAVALRELRALRLP